MADTSLRAGGHGVLYGIFPIGKIAKNRDTLADLAAAISPDPNRLESSPFGF